MAVESKREENSLFNSTKLGKSGKIVFLILFLFLFFYEGRAQQEKELIKNLAPAYREWLEIVSPIITSTEKEVFLKLKTDRERDKFINFFWKIRDPNPDTEENEFYREYMERVHFADQYFSIGSSKRGCLTERGYYYLLLGKPLERQIFATQSDIWPMELWFYKGEEKYGLPGYFYLLFYQPEGMGDYRLYYPGVEGPEKLVIPSLTKERITRSKAIEIIKGINTELAKAAVSYLPEDRADTFSSFSSQTIIATIKSLPEKKFVTEYARNYLSYKDYVEVDYSHNYITSSAVAKVLQNDGHYFIHWTIEPDKINFAENQGLYSAIFELTIRLEDLKGNPVFSRTEEIPLRLNREQFEKHARQRFAFQDLFPVLPGSYKLLFLLKNKTAKDFTSYETNIIIPESPSEPYLSQIFLYHSRKDMNDNRIKAFSFNQKEYLISARNEFSPAEKLSLYCQLLNSKGLSEEASIELCFRALDYPEAVSCQKKLLKEIMNEKKEIVFEGIDLSQFKPGYYRIELSLIDRDKIKAVQKDNFILLAQPALTSPWVYSRLHRPMPSVEFLKTLASQHFLKGDYQETRQLLESILSSTPEDQESRLLLAKTLFALSEYKDSLTFAVPVYEKTKDREAAKVIALDYAKLKDWRSALIYLEKLMAEATEVSVLNLAAEAYLNLGEKERAITLLEKSLSLVPDQPSIKSWLEDLKKNR